MVAETSEASSPIEIEWQFDAIDLRPVERWLMGIAGTLPGHGSSLGPAVLATPKSTKHLVDTYVDTEDWRVGRAGYVLRARRGGNFAEVTLKDTAPASSGLRKRLEVTEPLPAEGINALDGRGPVGRRIRALAGRRRLRPILEVRTTRRPYDLRVGQAAVAEVALDETVIGTGNGERPTQLSRVEIEMSPEWVDALTPLVEQLRKTCGLQPASLSKFEAGLLALGLEVQGEPDFGPTEVTHASTLGEVAYAVVRKNLAAMLANEPGTRLGEDPEALHRMRVATRRMRAAISLFKQALPVEAQHVRDEIGWLARQLGDVRDLDVQLERMRHSTEESPDEDKEAMKELSRLLEGRRDDARAELLSSFESIRYESLVAGFGSMLRAGPTGASAAARAPAVAVAPDLLDARHSSVTKAAKLAKTSSDPDDFHALRIRGKRLRYALEFFSDVYEGRTAAMIRRVVKLQDSLGLMQDARVAVERLRELATDPGNSLSLSAVFVMGGIAERYRRDVAEIMKYLPKHLKGLKGSRWRKLRAVMEERQLELGALYRWHLQPPLAQVTGGRIVAAKCEDAEDTLDTAESDTSFSGSETAGGPADHAGSSSV